MEGIILEGHGDNDQQLQYCQKDLAQQFHLLAEHNHGCNGVSIMLYGCSLAHIHIPTNSILSTVDHTSSHVSLVN
jgi:hypothetical protein